MVVPCQTLKSSGSVYVVDELLAREVQLFLLYYMEKWAGIYLVANQHGRQRMSLDNMF